MKTINDMKWYVYAPGLETVYFPTRNEAREIAQMYRDFGYRGVHVAKKGG